MLRKIIALLLLLVMLPMIPALDNVAKQNEAHDIRLTVVANGSIDTVETNITINDPDGILIISFVPMQKNTASQDFNYTLPSTNTSKLGIYDCTVYAFSTIADNQAFSCSFEVNPSGKEYIPQITGPLLFGSILTLMFVSSILLIIASRIELFPVKVFLMILSGIVAIMNLGFVTGSFQEFFSIGSSLSGAFGTLYVAFVILLIGASIFLLVYLIIVAFKLYNIKRGFFIAPENE